MESAVKSWQATSSVDARVYFLLDKDMTQTINVVVHLVFFLVITFTFFDV